MKKPFSLKVVSFLLWLQIIAIIYSLILAWSAYAVPSSPSSGLWHLQQESEARRLGVATIAEVDLAHCIFFTVMEIIPLIIDAAGLFLISWRSWMGTFTCLCLNATFYLIEAKNLAPVAMVCLVLLFMPGARRYCEEAS